MQSSQKFAVAGFIVLLPQLAFGYAAQVVSASGAVTALSKDGAKKTLKANDTIDEGVKISTDKGASAKLLFTDDTIIDIGPESEFSVDQYKGSGENRTGMFSMAYGTIRSLVSKPVKGSGTYRVKTRDAVMGVRGTEFVVSTPYLPPGDSAPQSVSSDVFVTSGTVAVSSLPASTGTVGEMSVNMPSTTVTAGQAFSTSQFAAAAQTAQPQAMSATQVQSVVATSTVSDNTFNNAVSLDAAPTSEPAKANSTLVAANAAVGETISAVGSSALANIAVDAGVPTGISITDVLTAPPVVIIPGSLKTLTITIQ